MSILKEFREFAVKGNVVDMAVGVIIAGKLWMKWVVSSSLTKGLAGETRLPSDPELEKSE